MPIDRRLVKWDDEPSEPIDPRMVKWDYVPLVMPDGSSAVDAGKRLLEQRKFERLNDPTNGMSTGQKIAAGFGKSLYDTARGIQQIAGYRSAEQVEDDRRIDAPLMRTGAGVLGNIGGQVAQMSVPVGGLLGRTAGVLGKTAAPYLAAGARGGSFAAIQPMGVGENRGWEAGKGALLAAGGQGVANLTAGAARGAVSRMEPSARQLAEKASDMGIRVGMPQLSQNPMVRTVASQLDRLPFSGASKRSANNQRAFNEQVGSTFGAAEKKITPDVFAAAKTSLQETFERLSSKNNLALDTQHIAQLKSVIDDATRLGGTDTARMVRGWADELLSKVDATGKIPGKAYQSFDSRISKVLKSGGEPAHYLGQLRSVVQGAMDDSISAGDRQAWQMVRQQYAALKTVEPLVAKTTTGDISPAQLMGRVTSDGAGKVRMANNRGGKLGDLARVGQQFMKDAPNSGTADRLLVNAGIGGGLLGAQQTGLIDPQTALIAAGLLSGNRLVGKALSSRALTYGGSRTLSGLSRLTKPAPRLLPAGYQAGGGLLGMGEIDPETGLPYGY